LNARLAGKRLFEVGDEIHAVIEELHLSQDLRAAVEGAFHRAVDTEETNILFAGAQNLLDQPEFHDLRKLRAILRIVEEQKTLYDLMADAMTSEKAAVKIGHELGSDEIAECSVVTVPYRYGGDAVGVLAILGPRRMPYGRLLALATGTADSLGRHLEGVEIR